ncbi:MAG: response regulator [Kiritimatiellae bacterium]|nr:response regulator [Kiritimatiellia bacterium]
MHNYFYFYSTVSCIALCVHLIINWHQLADWRGAWTRAGALEFRLFVACLSVYFLADVLWGVFAGLKLPRALYFDTVVFFIAMALSVLAWTRFAVTYLGLGGRLRGCLLWSGRGLMAFLVGALLANGFTGAFFAIDPQCVYSAGPLRQVAFSLLAAFNAFGAAVTFNKLLHTRGAARRHNKMVFAFGVSMTAAILVQLSDPLLPLYSIGCLFGCCFLHVFVIEDERDEMHRQELLARDYEAQLRAERESNKAKSLFFSSVSHDIRTPLNAIIGFSELLEQGVADEDARARYISSIRSSGKVLARLVNDILDLSKLESGKLEVVEEPTHIPTLAREVIAACEVARARKSLTLKTEIGAMPWVSIDPQRVRQILFNLLSNAYKYTDHGTISVRVLWQDGTLSLSVADTGKGISEEDITRILQPFVQLADRNHRDGTGLGLPICQRLAALMGGELAIASKVGEGSTFTVTFRNVRTVDPPERRQVQASNPGRLTSRVLVVDDSHINREVLRAMLSKIGVDNVAMAENGRRALEALENGPDFDMVLSDLWMPEMDGFDLIRAIRSNARLAHLPAYLITADVEALGKAESNGATGILLKPITLDKLQALFT